MITKVLLIGFGDVALRLAGLLPRDTFECHGLRRHTEHLPPPIHGIAWDLNCSEGLAERIAGFDIVVITVVPNSRDAVGYQQAWAENTKNIVAGLETGPSKPKLVLFASSTSVYGQNQGEWVDEQSPTEPENFRGRAVLQGERLLRDSSLDECIVRFSGIYGPGRERLLKQVRNGEHSERDATNYSNRIHADDCAGVLSHLIQRKLAGETIKNVYLASDCEPVPLAEVKDRLAEQMGLAEPVSSPESAVQQDEAKPLRGNKRCSNKRLLASGYEFRYPSFREGYSELLLP